MSLAQNPQSRRRHCWLPLQSADAIAGDEDLMTEILIRLPAKSLCRFKCVSKPWYSLISHPRFSLLRMPKSVSGFFLPARSRDEERLYNFVYLSGGDPTWVSPFKSLSFVADRFTILHSCNGLFLCSSTAIDNKSYYIYNPTTKQFADMPPPPPPPPPLPLPCPPSINLAFDLSRAPHFKIVLVRPCGALNFQIEIYSSETLTWRPSGDPFPADRHVQCFTNGVFLNGTMHWVSIESETSLRFDIDRECLETMPMPPIQDSSECMIINYYGQLIQDNSECRSILYFGESRGHLHLICGIDYTAPPHQFDVLEMKSDYSNWFVKYRFDLDAFKTIPVFKEYPFSFSVLHIVRGKEEEQSYLVLYIEGRVISYNLNDKIAKKICYLPLDSSMRCWQSVSLDRYRRRFGFGQRSTVHQFHQYIETLFRI